MAAQVAEPHQNRIWLMMAQAGSNRVALIDQAHAGHGSAALAWVSIGAIFALVGLVNRAMGRRWWCDGGGAFLWANDIWSHHNSQHLADPYSFSHLLHGLIFAGLIALVPWLGRQSFAWRLALAVVVEGSWEIIENTPMVINRYREQTAALGYNGDTIINSMGDIAFMMIGFLIACRVRWQVSLGLFVIFELVLLVTIRDNLTLNVLMLLWPIKAIKDWQVPGQ